MICEKCEALNALIDGYRRERDEAINALHGVQASLQRKVRHCDEIEQERDNALRERDEAREEVQDYREQLRKLPDANRVASQDAYRRGAEAMRFACQQWCRAWENDGEAIADALADLRVEDKP